MPDLLQVDKDVYKAVRRRDMDLTPSQQEVIRMNLPASRTRTCSMGHI
jgi:ribosome recycling factor